MNRMVLGALVALLLTAAGVFWWQGRAETQIGVLPPLPAMGSGPGADLIPTQDGSGLRGPTPPEALEVTREQRRFDRLDRDRDSRITRNEILLPRVAAFRKLDRDGNNLLSFEEWAGRTSDKFHGADANRNGALDRREFARTKPKRPDRPDCRCPQPRPGSARRAVPPPDAIDDLDDEGADPSGEI